MKSLTVISARKVRETIQGLRIDQGTYKSITPISLRLSPTSQPWILVGPWLDLIKRSRGLSDGGIHRIVLLSRFLVLFQDVGERVLLSGRLFQNDDIDLVDHFSKDIMDGLKIMEVVQH